MQRDYHCEVVSGGNDSVGNRTKSQINGTAATFTYNEANQILTKNGTDFRYDADGNLTQDDQFNYAYDALCNQTNVSKLDETEVARYAYDENGFRTKKIMGNQTNEYYYDSDSNNLILEITKKGNELQSYHYYQWDPNGHVVGMVVKDKDSSGNWKTTPYYFLTNQRGDVVQIVNQSGDKVGSYTYDAYGNILSEDGAIAKDNDVRYASYAYDSETKHYYLQARYYDPQNGNFLAMDPDPGDSDDPISQNGYTYANNNPGKYSDSDGKWALVFAAAVPGLGQALLITVGLYITYQGILWLCRKSSEYKDVKEKGSRFANRKTNVTKKEFEKNLKRNGWKKTKSKDGKADIFTKKGAKYSIRNHARTYKDGPTAEFTPRGSKRIKLKIRLKK